MSAIAPILHKALLAGTSRVPLEKHLAELAASAEIAAILPPASTTPGSQPASGQPALLWHALAANELWQRAGFVPASADEKHSAKPVPAPDDARSCPPAAEQILHLILRGIHPELLETWLACAASAGARIPHQFLVHLLADGMNKPTLRPLLPPLLDARGTWLVAQHPAWRTRYGSVDIDDTDGQWQHGDSIDRSRALRVMRQRDPAQARQKLEADWANEAPENRALLLPCLAVGLSLDDEPFLEQMLDDKRKEVRLAATALLRSLENSQLMQRCANTLHSLFRLERIDAGEVASPGIAAQVGKFFGKLTGKATATDSVQLADFKLELTLPQECSKAMKRDGIGAQKMPTLGEKAGWLYDLMRSVTPGHWCRSWQQNPQQVLAMLEVQEFKTAVITGLTSAAANAIQFRNDGEPGSDNCAWFALLLERIGQGWSGFDYAILPELMRHFPLLPQAQQEQLLLQWLQQSQAPAKTLAVGDTQIKLGLVNPAQSLLNQWSQQRASGSALSPQLSKAFLSHAQAALLRQAKDYASEWEIRHRFKQLGEWLAIDDLAYTEQGWPDSSWAEWPQWVDAIDKFQETLRFRHQLEASFLETAP